MWPCRGRGPEFPLSDLVSGICPAESLVEHGHKTLRVDHAESLPAQVFYVRLESACSAT